MVRQSLARRTRIGPLQLEKDTGQGVQIGLKSLTVFCTGMQRNSNHHQKLSGQREKHNFMDVVHSPLFQSFQKSYLRFSENHRKLRRKPVI